MKTQSSYYLTALLFGFILSSLVGCGASPIQRVHIAEKLYTSTADSLTESINAGLITDKQTLAAIRTAAVEADQELDAAKEAALSGDRLQWPFVWSRTSKALDRLLILYAKHHTGRNDHVD